MDQFVEEHKCPLTTELLCDPVTAEDGHNYEREMVEKLIKDSSCKRNKKQKKLLRSPRTNEAMGAEIKSDVSLRNTIQNFIESGLIGGEVAESWRQRKLIIDTKKLAEDGDPNAMQRLGEWYDGGLQGLPRSDVLARKWITKADSARVLQAVRRVREDKDPDAMNSLGMWYSEGEKVWLPMRFRPSSTSRCWQIATMHEEWPKPAFVSPMELEQRVMSTLVWVWH